MDVTREQRAVQLADLDRRMRDETEREAVLARRAPDWYGTLRWLVKYSAEEKEGLPVKGPLTLAVSYLLGSRFGRTSFTRRGSRPRSSTSTCRRSSCPAPSR